MDVFLVSNMYPSVKDPYYGSFIKIFYDEMEKKGYNLKLNALIKGRTKSVIVKLWKYIAFYSEMILKGLFGRYDIIYVHTVSHTAIPILFICLFRSPKIVINPHGGDVITINPLEKKLLFFVQLLINKADLIIVPSHFFRGHIISEFKADEHKIFVSASAGVNTQQFAPQKSVSTISHNDVLNIGYVSRIDRGKGWDVFLHAINIIVKDNLIPQLQCVIAGDGNEVKAMLTLIEELDLSDIVNYIGPKSNIQLPAVYADFDVFVFPTMLTESLGLVGLEAMACGVPVIGSELGGLTDYLTDRYNGLFFILGDAADLAKKIVDIYGLNSEAKDALSKNARNTAKEYDSEKIINDLSNKLQATFNN